MSSFAGLATALLPWLLVGGTLVLHHPFDPDDLRRSAARDERSMRWSCRAAGRAIDGGRRAGRRHRPEQRARRSGARPTAWRARRPGGRPTTDMVDIQVFGEIGLIAARRGAGGRAGVVPFGPVAVPRGSKGGVIVGEVRATANGTVAMRGPMVPRFAFPPGVERTHAAPAQGGADRLCRYRLRLLERPGQRAPGGHRAAARHGQRRRLSLPDARPAGRDRRGRRGRDAGGAARCA